MDLLIPLAGIRAASLRMDRAATDIARAAHATQDDASSADGTPPAAQRVPTASVDAPEVDLPSAMVDLISASQAVTANLQSLRRTDDALGALLDRR